MKRFSMAMVSVVVAAAAVAHAQLAADSAKVFVGEHGEQVALVLLKPAESGNFVVRFSGTGGILDGLALPAKRSVDGYREYYTTEWHGRSRSYLQVERRRGEHWDLYRPGQLNQAIALRYDDAATKALKIQDVLALHDRQLKDGTISKFAAFHRDEEQADHERTLAKEAAAVEKACGGRIPISVDWKTVDNDLLKTLSISSFCEPPLNALAALCGQAPLAQSLLKEKVKSVSCRFGGEAKLSLEGGKLDWVVNAQAANLDELARRSLEGLEVAPPIATSGPEKPPWGDARTLGQRITLARTTVCTDGKSHYAVLAPGGDDGLHMYWGDGKQMFRVPTQGLLGPGSFLEPRYVNPQANPSFRGLDCRIHSSVEYDAEKASCHVHCGVRDVPLKILSGSEATPLLTAAAWQLPLTRRLPHALTRDDRGTYYYVDKGATAGAERSFRLFVGPKGGMKLQKMTNVTSDSKGEIFSTKSGDLRFIVGPNGTDSTWVQGKSRQSLVAVPVEDNWALIYNELGVYVGQRFGTPCDDL